MSTKETGRCYARFTRRTCYYWAPLSLNGAITFGICWVPCSGKKAPSIAGQLSCIFVLEQMVNFFFGGGVKVGHLHKKGGPSWECGGWPRSVSKTVKYLETDSSHAKDNRAQKVSQTKQCGSTNSCQLPCCVSLSFLLLSSPPANFHCHPPAHAFLPTPLARPQFCFLLPSVPLLWSRENVWPGVKTAESLLHMTSIWVTRGKSLPQGTFFQTGAE